MRTNQRGKTNMKATLKYALPALAIIVLVIIWANRSGKSTMISAADPGGKLSLVDYIHQQKLPCLQCHQLTTGSYGPGFKVVARNYKSNSKALATLATHIEKGYGFMPGGLASKEQAEVLADKIMKLNLNQ
ncbi:MAG TPA: hypothetical protein VFX23_07610 [Limnobacter sp.]|uniref:c-type cytochrome n=1 Tax=Limnobacter sp. TaxID=2003368 RepID=UPI002E31E565|nr:hypothetical protein [Limnobacter sp.]HEX5485847.1 hypothetical protein [Limnobacter sp.]